MVQRGRPQPPYVQVADIIRRRIASGELAPGEQLPPLIALAEQMDVSLSTVRKGVDLLKAEGLIVAVAGYGTFVRE
jgi:DNA-binding GntR family transcriptional regulator